ncbi:MAG: CDP-alcohol phosphatidyltransferase family protein [Oscillospiraceae bacterium]|nr:CDP-alcohol phosphatidyltransferase family protein [Oscillospiraceae bacterium]
MMKNMQKQIPNILSVIRLLCIPVFVLLFKRGYSVAAAGVFCGASLTDVIDGYLARRNNWITNVGKILDPLADKLMQFTVLLCLTLFSFEGGAHIIACIVLVLFTLKELAMLAGAIVVLRVKRNVVGSVWYGKLATVIFFVITITLILDPNNFALSAVLCTLLVCTILFALVMYYVKVFRGHYGIKKIENMRRTKE